MASAKSVVHLLQLKAVEVPDFLQKGQRFFKFDDIETSFTGTFVILRVDPKGHVLYWASAAGQSTDYVETMYILDSRYGKSAKQPKNADKMKDKLCPSFVPISSFDNCMMTIVTGNNFVDLKYLTFVAPSPQDAQEWSDAVFKIATNLLSLNGSVMQFLEKAYAKIRYAITDKEIRSREIVDTFASQREDRKRIEGALKEANLSSGKDDTLAVDQLTEEHFFTFYRFLTQRTEVAKIFESVQKLPTAGSADHHNNSCWTTPVITADQLVKFLNDEQRDPRLNEILYPFYTKKSALKLIQQYEPDEEYSSKGVMTIEGFLRFLLGDDNQVLAEEYFDLRTDDMNEPMAHYYVNSSHNTYLVGPQMGGKSSVEMYRQVLIAGCRSVELDCWDGRTGNLLGQPVITHGPQALTMVPELPFKDVLEAIAESAFKTSEYPVILSLEVRCSEKNQERIAALCREVFKDSLLTEPLPSHPLEPGVPLPSPAMLKRKILVKCKCRRSTSGPGSRQSSWKIRHGSSMMYSDAFSAPSFSVPCGTGGGIGVGDISLDTSDCSSITPAAAAAAASVLHHSGSTDRPSTASDSASTPTATNSSSAGGELVRVCSIGPHHHHQNHNHHNHHHQQQQHVLNDVPSEETSSTRQVDSDDDSESDSSTVHESAQQKQQKQKEVSRELSALANYCAGARFKSFDEAEKRNVSWEICSFNEANGYELIRKNVTDFVNFNKRQLSRIYPQGVRIASSNYMPHIFWGAGCQMVALNFQTLDTLPMQLNQGLFDMNGRCGYVLKPACMRKRDRHFDPFEENAVENVVANTVTVLVISGQMLSKTRVSTYVDVEMYGLPADTVKRRYRTKTVQNNGINPVYSELDGRPFEFTKVILPDLASIRFAVYEDGSRSIIGLRILPVAGLRPGYRHITLRNAIGQPQGLATLFVKIVVKDFVPEAHLDTVRGLLDPITYVNNVYGRLDDIADALVNPILHTRKLEQRDQLLNSMMDEDPSGASEPQYTPQKGSLREKRSQPRPALNGLLAQSKSEQNSISGRCSVSPRPQLMQSFQTSDPGPGRMDDSPSPTVEKSTKKPLSLPKPIKFGLYGGGGGSNRSGGGGGSTGASAGTGGGGGACPPYYTIETFKFSYPSIENLERDKKITKLQKKHERDLELLQARHGKDRDVLCKKHKRKQAELQSHQSKAMDILLQTNEKSISKADRMDASAFEDLKAQTERKREQLRQEQNKEKLQLKDRNERELRSNCSKQWAEELAFLQDSEELVCQCRLSIVDQSFKINIRTLETLYQRETGEVMKRTQENRKIEYDNLIKSGLDKEHFSKQKLEMEKRIINASVEQRKKLEMIKENRQEEMTKMYEDLKEAIKKSCAVKVDNYNKFYEERILKGEVPRETTRF